MIHLGGSPSIHPGPPRQASSCQSREMIDHACWGEWEKGRKRGNVDRPDTVGDCGGGRIQAHRRLGRGSWLLAEFISLLLLYFSSLLIEFLLISLSFPQIPLFPSFSYFRSLIVPIYNFITLIYTHPPTPTHTHIHTHTHTHITMKTSISSDVWEKKKALIAKLYMEEEWPLKQVIKQIRSDDFNPR